MDPVTVALVKTTCHRPENFVESFALVARLVTQLYAHSFGNYTLAIDRKAR